MSRPVLDRLKDIVHSAELAASHTDADGLAREPQRSDAALFRIAVIGEAASQLPAEVQALAPEIPWPKVRGMRNHIIHGYWQIDLEDVAETIALDLEPLKAAANRLIGLIERTES
jgi:uncharacterized protein with HEPN domain